MPLCILRQLPPTVYSTQLGACQMLRCTRNVDRSVDYGCSQGDRARGSSHKVAPHEASMEVLTLCISLICLCRSLRLLSEVRFPLGLNIITTVGEHAQAPFSAFRVT